MFVTGVLTVLQGSNYSERGLSLGLQYPLVYWAFYKYPQSPCWNIHDSEEFNICFMPVYWSQ